MMSTYKIRRLIAVCRPPPMRSRCSITAEKVDPGGEDINLSQKSKVARQLLPLVSRFGCSQGDRLGRAGVELGAVEGVVFNDAEDGGQQLAHHDDRSSLFGFAAPRQVLVESVVRERR